MQRIERFAAKIADPELAARLRTAGRAALAAGAIQRDLYEKPIAIRHKGVVDLVTEADLASEKAILDILTREHPGVRVLSEESANTYDAAPREPCWVVDPLDGTTNFAHGFPWFGVSIACLERGRSRLGVIYCPMQEELFLAAAGAGARLNDRAIRVSEVRELEQGLIATGFPYDIRQKVDRIMAMLEKILIHAQGIRRPGAAALDLAYLACGRLDGFWEVGLKPWDSAAGQLIVEEAGGRLTNLQGAPFSPFVPELLASNGRLHDHLVALLAEFSEEKGR